MNSLKNKIVLITGTSSGIGKACAESFAKEGAHVILNGRRKEKVEQHAIYLSEKYGVKTLPLIFDVKNKTEVKEKISSLPDEWNKIDILVNNAGLGKGLDKIYEGKTEDWELMIDTNLKGLLYVTREILPQMIDRKSGHIINIGSVAGHDVYPGGNVYCATKFAVKALSQAMRIDVLDKYVKISSVDPGMVETEFSNVRFNGDIERAKNVYKGLTPLTGEDIADAVIYCATRPWHVNINEIILTPIAQAHVNFVVRE